MRKRSLSSSSIKTFLQCSLKYYFNYEDKKPKLVQTDALGFGVAVHAGLEEMHKIVAASGASPKAEDYDTVLKKFIDVAIQQKLDNQALYDEGRQILIRRLDNVDPSEKILGLELGFELETPNGTPFLGHIDKLIEIDESTVAVVDYKTSQMAMPQEEADSDIQLSMYDLAVSILYPQYTTIISVLDFVRIGDVITYRTPEQRNNFSDFLDAVYKQICDMEVEGVLPSLNSFCPWCDFKSYCPEYQKVINDPDLLSLPKGEYSDKELIDAWEKVSASRKILDTQYNELKDEVYTRMNRKNSIKSDQKELVKSQGSRSSYDARTVFNVVGPDKFFNLVSVNKTAADRVLKDIPDAAAEVDRTASYSFISPSFKVKKLK